MEMVHKFIQVLVVFGFLQLMIIGVSAAPIGFGETVIGTLSTGTQTDIYTFDAIKGDTIYVRMHTSWGTGPQIRLLFSNGTHLSTVSDVNFFAEMEQVLPSTGTYQIQVGDNGGDSTGSYGLYLQRTNNPGNTVSIAFGETKIDSITKQAQMNNYTFTAIAGDKIYVRMHSIWGSGPQVRLYAPNGTRISLLSDVNFFTESEQILPTTGTYTILVGDNGGDSTGSYGLYLQRTNNPGNTVSIAFGETKIDSITKQAQMNNYTFTATAGDKIYVRMHSIWGSGPQVRLYAPNGTRISLFSDVNFFTETEQILPTTGTYTILVGDNGGDSTGSYGLYLQRTNNPGNTVSIAFGETKIDSITKQAQMNNYTFAGAGCDRIYIGMQSIWGSGPQVRLYAPNGTRISLFSDVNFFTETEQILPTTGTYTILVGDNGGDATGSYTLSLQYLGSLAPVADFSANKTSGPVSLTVKFTDATTESPYAWNWSFGDGTFSTEQNPVHTYTVDGKYTVSLNATKSCNSNISTKTGYITVYPLPPVASFTATPRSGNKPLTVVFTDTSTNTPTSWNWSFGDGSLVNATQKNPVHTYANAGTYTVSLNATNAGGSNTRTSAAYITVTTSPPVANFTATPRSGNKPLTVVFTDTSTNTPTSWNWSFGDGSLVNATQKNPVHTYANVGTYTVSLNATNAAGSDTKISAAYIRVDFPSLVADFRGTPLSGSAPLTVAFYDLSLNNPTGWTWYFGDETYAGAWSLVNASAGWSGRRWHSSVALPDGSIVLTGGDGIWNGDAWRSTDHGATWRMVNASSGWSGRQWHSSVVLPDRSIVLMGGNSGGTDKNDVWRSTDNGTTWMQINASAGWSARVQHSSVALSDGSIVLMGGRDGPNPSNVTNDVWRSTDKGVTWKRINASAGWSGRFGQTSVVLPDGSIVLMGGEANGGIQKNDVWRSTDNGVKWALVNASAGWSARYGHNSVVMTDGSIVLAGGYDGVSRNDTWRSTDNGKTWTQLTGAAGWPARFGHSSVSLPDGSIVLTGGSDGSGTFLNDVWRSQPAGSSVQNPSHTYTRPATYAVTLQVYNAYGSNSTRKTGYITVTPPGTPDRIGIYKDGSWYIDMNGDGVWNTGDQNYGFGAPNWTPMAGDWNNDDKTEIGVYRDGSWYLDYDATGWWSAGDKNYGYGAPNWTPVAGDWNGGGSDKIGAYKDGAWYLDYDGSGTWNAGDKNYAFGGPGWTPVTGKWTADGKSKIGVYKDGVYYIDYNGNGTYDGGDKAIVYGTTGSTAVTGDWNANGLTEVGTKTGKAWQLDYDGLGAVNASTKLYYFGAASWNPVIGDWNADGNDKIGIFQNGAWYLDYNGNGVWDAGTDNNFAFGSAGWIPVVGKWS